MKRYGNLYPKICDICNIAKAHKNAMRGKRHYKGVPIGNYLSQFFGNLYLSGFDHWMKEEQKCKYYFRYCDDIVVLHADKKHLAKLRIKVEKYLKTELDLILKGNWQVFPVSIRGIDFLGYRFFS